LSGDKKKKALSSLLIQRTPLKVKSLDKLLTQLTGTAL